MNKISSGKIMGDPADGYLQSDSAELPYLVAGINDQTDEAIKLVSGQWLELGDHNDRCFGDFSKCQNGFTGVVWFKLVPPDTAIPDQTIPVFTNAGYDEESPGMWVTI